MDAARPGILFINSSPVFGGTERWTVLAACELARRGYPVWLGYRYNHMARIAQRSGLKTVRLPLLNDADLLSVTKIARFVQKERVGFVIPTRVKEYWLGALGARAGGAQTYIRLGLVRSIENKWKNRWLYGRLSRAIVVNARAIRVRLLETGFIPWEKIHLIYNGVEIPAHLPAYRPDPNPFRFVFVGALVERKRVDLLLRAFATLRHRHPHRPTTLSIAGEGPRRAALEQLSQQLGLAGSVSFLGHQSQIGALLSRSDALVLPSANEGVPNAALEAMAWGVPAVLTRVGGITELIQDRWNGLLVSEGHLEHLAEAMERLLTSPVLRQKIRRTAYQYVRSNHSLDKMGDALEGLLTGRATAN
ncbi:MAG: glycosyltransferase [Calditrichaeota bacterium]|nr:MAG: glycosyltransferase [Calditrichota bacterium]